MSVEKINFEKLIQDNKLFDKPMHLGIISDNIAWFGNTIFSNHFILNNIGIHFQDYSDITTLTSKNANTQTFIFNFYERVTSHNIKALQFNDCFFKEEPIINNQAIQDIFFYNCEFNCDIYNLLKNDNDNKLNIAFINCKISRVLINSAFGIDNELYPFKIDEGSIQQLQINNKVIKNEFYINKQHSSNKEITKIKEIIIEDTIFQENFKLHNCEIENIHIENVDFEKHADFYMSDFKQGLDYHNLDDENKKLDINFKAINFKGLAIFGDCIFQKKLIFEWVTFESFSHFRKTEFHKGLDLDYTNIEEEMNFFSIIKLDSKESIKNTSQETYRIIKHNFEKIENKIEANKYHALELEKKLEDSTTPLQERIILCFHWFFSRNGTSWIIPFLFIFAVGLGTVLFIHLDSLTIQDFKRWELLKKGFFESFKYIYILYKDNSLWDNHPIIFALNKFSLGYLYYQFLIAVRKDTRK